MKKYFLICSLIALIPHFYCHNEDKSGLVSWWKFDNSCGNIALDNISRIEDPIRGKAKFQKGVSGLCLRFDSYTTYMVRQSDSFPPITDALTIEAWIAPQDYPSEWTAILDQVKATKDTLLPGLTGRWFGSSNFTEERDPIKLDEINQDWTESGEKDWSARWHGFIEAPFTGDVTFYAEADDGLKLVLNSKEVIDGLGRDGSRSGKISMVKGKNIQSFCLISPPVKEPYSVFTGAGLGKEKLQLQQTFSGIL